MPAVLIASGAGLVLYLNHVDIRRVRHIRFGFVRLNLGSLSGFIRLDFGSVPGCIGFCLGGIAGCICTHYASSSCSVPSGIRISSGGVAGCICGSSGSIPGCIRISSGSVPGCIGGVIVIVIGVIVVVVMRIARASVPGHTTMISVATPRPSMTVTAMASSTMIATLSMAAATVAASAVTTVTTTASATAIFGVHAGETTDVIGHQDRRCRQDTANCQSQQTFFEQHDAPPLGVASSSPY
ncbi:hypothetical protein [Pseudomonas sp. GM55]|uniref:hypothetical protein n=1 Tax=Pseudomonas sp. GM55 TaxID=1144333 RepID=UPI0012F975B9